MFTLQFSSADINYWAAQYPLGKEEVELIEIVVPRVRAIGFIPKADFIRLGRWKTPRATPRYEANSDSDIQEITRVALRSSSERLRIGALLSLEGVSYPVASALLHLTHRDAYPLLDYRALWSLGIASAPAYTFGFWLSYVEYCRELAVNSGVSMRTLDRALWQYSKANQG